MEKLALQALSDPRASAPTVPVPGVPSAVWAYKKASNSLSKPRGPAKSEHTLPMRQQEESHCRGLLLLVLGEDVQGSTATEASHGVTDIHMFGSLSCFMKESVGLG